MDDSTISRFRELMEEERLDDALALLENTIHSDPSDWNAIYLSGVVLRGKGDLRRAVHRYKQALDIFSDADPVHHALGVAYQQLGEYASAISAFQSALRLNPGRFETLNSLGLTYKLAGDYHQAIDFYRHALDLCVEGAFQETLKEQHKYFLIDESTGQRRLCVRPEYFQAMRSLLVTDMNYYIILGNIAACHDAMGDHTKAEELRSMAESCTPIDADLIGPIRRRSSQ